jgi:O-antigen/teichoic acid export membrane protein
MERVRGLARQVTPGLRQTASYAGSDGLVLVAALVQGLVVARVLGPAGFGVYSLLLAYTALVFTLLDPRAAEAVSRYLSEHLGSGDRASALAVMRAGYVFDGALTLVAGAIALSTLLPLATLVLPDGTAPGWPAYALAVLATATLAPTATARAVLATTRRLPALTRLQVGMAAARVVASGGLLAADPSIAEALAVQAVLAALELGVLTLLIHRHGRRSLGGTPLTASLEPLRGQRRAMLRFVVYADLSSLVGVLVKQLDVLVLGAIAGPTEAGYYRLARQVSNTLATPAQSLQTVVYPRLSAAAAAADWTRLRNLMRVCTQAGVALAACTLVVVAVLPQLLRLVTGPEYGPAIPAAVILTLGAAISNAFFVFRPLFLATGNLQPFLVIVTATGLSGLLLFALVSDPYGATGVATARTLVVALAGNAAGAVFAWRWMRSRPRVTAPG